MPSFRGYKFYIYTLKKRSIVFDELYSSSLLLFVFHKPVNHLIHKNNRILNETKVDQKQYTIFSSGFGRLQGKG